VDEKPRPLKLNKAPIKPKGYWQDVNNRKKFFIDFARAKGFDDTDPHQWQAITNSQIEDEKVRVCMAAVVIANVVPPFFQGARLLKLYNHSLRQALESTFPELKLKGNVTNVSTTSQPTFLSPPYKQ